MGAALNLLLREKTFLGLAEPPDETVPFELLTRNDLTRRALSERRERVSAAGGQLLGAALAMVGELLADKRQPEPDGQAVSQIHSSLADCVERDGDGRPQLRLTLPDEASLTQLASSLARLLVPGLTR